AICFERPAMIHTLQYFLLTRFISFKFCRTMWTNIIKCSQCFVCPTHNDNRLVHHICSKKLSRLFYLTHMTYKMPRLIKNELSFFLQHFWICVHVIGHCSFKSSVCRVLHFVISHCLLSPNF